MLQCKELTSREGPSFGQERRLRWTLALQISPKIVLPACWRWNGSPHREGLGTRDPAGSLCSLSQPLQLLFVVIKQPGLSFFMKEKPILYSQN